MSEGKEFDSSIFKTALENAFPPPGLAVGLSDKHLTGMITIKVNSISDIPNDSFKEVTGCDIPEVRKFTTSQDNIRISSLWMAPDELMIHTGYGEVDDMVSSLREMLSSLSIPFMCVNVSDARSTFEIRGDMAREVLAKGSPTDFRQDNFSVGDVRRTRIADISVAIYQKATSPDVFEIFCFRSYSKYIWTWLCSNSSPGTFPMVIQASSSE